MIVIPYVRSDYYLRGKIAIFTIFILFIRHIGQELIRREVSESELFYDDIVHVEASAHAH